MGDRQDFKSLEGQGRIITERCSSELDHERIDVPQATKAKCSNSEKIVVRKQCFKY